MGTKVNLYSIGDPNLTRLMDAVDVERIGFCAVSLTHYDDDVEPEIAAGSKIEINGALFEFDTDESITGSPADGTVYIKLIPDENAVSAIFTATAPTWDTTKQGWYEAATNNRYLPYEITKSGSSYSNKCEIPLVADNDIKFRSDGTIIAKDLLLPDSVSIAENGYLKIAGLIIQWGHTGSGKISGPGSVQINFPTAFPNACFSVVLGATQLSYSATYNAPMMMQVRDVTTAKFNLLHALSNTAYYNNYWIAIGY